MKHSFLLLLILLFLLSACATDTTQKQAKTISADVTDVVDGDTIKVSMDGKSETVRLLLVDTPETKHPSKPVQPYGPEASTFAEETLEGEEIELELGISERDKYGRLLAYVWIEDNMFNELLLEKGLARVAYIYQPNVKYVEEFQSLQRTAQTEGVGIWSIEDYVREDGFKGEEQLPPMEPDNDCTIKGNINSKGKKIYHLPDGAYYEMTNAEELFCSKEDAKAAGFRPSSR
ncbi:thermonuclease family protein [Guptibacillus algicola]|uniref:thermonuclease family protein n=1 Tax=Guptibacillus algicola TaxID=225844 RepID=UPI001CD816A0|nr:thermonuclease family protein [Alkalihalobacillus algicola]MCA0986460.1 thermonuclease family protein [Alkalihalobacillus algicola]